MLVGPCRIRIGKDALAAVGILCAGYSSLDTDVACLPPGGSPRVLDQPVICAVICAVADNQHTVVEGGVGTVGHNAGLVRLPTLACVNADRDGSILYEPRGHLKLVLRHALMGSNSGASVPGELGRIAIPGGAT